MGATSGGAGGSPERRDQLGHVDALASDEVVEDLEEEVIELGEEEDSYEAFEHMAVSCRPRQLAQPPPR